LKTVRRRYLALTFEPCEVFGSGEFMETVWKAILKLYGEVGASCVGLSLVEFDGEEGSAVLRVGHNGLEMARAALASITRVDDKPVAVHVLRVSGTLKALREKLKH